MGVPGHRLLCSNVTLRLTPHDFQYFVDHMHQRGVGVLIDWVPGHFPTDVHGLAMFDGTCLYEHADPRLGFHPDWNTLIFNYGRREVTEFLISSASSGATFTILTAFELMRWLRCFIWIIHATPASGFRISTVAVRTWKRSTSCEAINTLMHAEFPGVMTIAEESTAWPGVSRPCYTGGLGFTMKWDMGWMNDTLRFMRRDPSSDGYHLNDLTFRSIYAFSENFVLPLSHDEVVHGKHSLLSQMSGDTWQKFANLRLLLSMQFATPGKKLLFMGTEIGQWNEWNHDGEVEWILRTFEPHEGIRRLVCDLNRLAPPLGVCMFKAVTGPQKTR
jgi:1,4-alpha-glucan branching enzyme